MPAPTKRSLLKIYTQLYRTFGAQHWWPGDTPFEIIVGAILTQNTNWANVERAITNLKHARVLSAKKLHQLSAKRLAQLIRPSGYFNIKARRLKSFMNFLFAEYGGSLATMRREPLATLRPKLLAVNGIGPETADSILLYACDKPTFVVDAYTKRILSRHKFCSPDADYQTVQKIFMTCLPSDPKLFNEYHALIVKLGKEFCRPKPTCLECPLRRL